MDGLVPRMLPMKRNKTGSVDTAAANQSRYNIYDKITKAVLSVCSALPIFCFNRLMVFYRKMFRWPLLRYVEQIGYGTLGLVIFLMIWISKLHL